MRRYAAALRTPQAVPAPEVHQVRNRAGGYVFPITDREQFRRFLILGSADGSYYATPRELTRENLTVLDRLLEEDARWALEEIVYVSHERVAPRNDAAILALAKTLKQAPDVEIRRAAAMAVPDVCRTGTHLMQLVEAIEWFGGWSRVSRRAVSDWYQHMGENSLAYQLVKYRQRGGWTNRDALRLSHPKTYEPARDELYAFACIGAEAEVALDQHPMIEGFLKAQGAHSGPEVARLVREYRLPWEAVPPAFSRDVEVQSELARQMPPHALLRQLGRLTVAGVFRDRDMVDTVAKKVSVAAVHPMHVYMALRTYGAGRGLRGKLNWVVVPDIMAALETGFRNAFQYLEPDPRPLVIGMDMSGSMVGGMVSDIPGFSAAEAAAVTGWVLSRTYPNARLVGFDTRPYEAGALMLADTAESAIRRYRSVMGRLGQGTDCSVPIAWADQNMRGTPADFIILTDAETWAGHIHPFQALQHYRMNWKHDAAMVEVAFVASGYSTGQAQDARVLRCVGFDANLPGLIHEFLGEELPKAA